MGQSHEQSEEQWQTMLDINPYRRLAHVQGGYADPDRAEPGRVDHHYRVDAGLLPGSQGVSGEPRPYRALPWFWSNQYATKFKTVGVRGGYDQTVVRGEVASGSFAVVYQNGTQRVAVDAIKSMRDYAGGRSLIGRDVEVVALAEPSISLTRLGKSSD
jgi:Reductase C-terminal